MTSEMIERMARAMVGYLRPAQAKCPTELLSHVDVDDSDLDVMALARAALEAMREPTEAMINDPRARCYNYGEFGDKEVRRIWTAMINAALAERGSR